MTRRYLLALALSLLLAADLGWKAWNGRPTEPYIVTQWGYSNGDGLIKYSLPGGGTGEVRIPAIMESEKSGECWRHATIGQPLPQCAYSWDELLRYPR